jgi:Glycoside hydrolase family 44
VNRRTANLWLVVVVVAGMVPLLGLSAYWASTQGSGLLDRLQDRGRQPVASGGPDVMVDASAQGRTISPLIYGVAFADALTLKQLGATVDRWGGNTATTYNWTNRCWNAARDWEFRNKPADTDPDTFVRASLASGAVPLMTVPTIGWVARDCSNATQSTGVPAGGGSPLTPASVAIAGYDPSRNRAAVYVPSAARRPAGPDARTVYQDDWVRHLQQAGAHYYSLDNEPDAWAETHTDLRPVPAGYDDMLRTFTQYADAVKDADPAALLLGPAICCWTTMFYSDLDRGRDNFRTHADRQAHGGQELLPWWLQQVARHDRQAGTRTLGLLDVHFYPQAPGVLSEASDAATRDLRVRSVRALYDPNYRDESWIQDQVQLIPRLQQWVREDYPGTGIAITEYSFGGERDASGAVAQAEALGVFGQYGVDLATYWTYPAPDSPAGAAFRLFRNFDGAGAAFGDRSLAVTSRHAGIRAFAAGHASRKEIDVVLANESQIDAATVSLGVSGAAIQAIDEFRLAPGSATIQPGGLQEPSVTLAPLGLSLVRITLA